jgi:hypothetical protein
LVPRIAAVNIGNIPIGRKRNRKSILSNQLPHQVYVRMNTITPVAIMAAPVTSRPTLAPKDIETMTLCSLTTSE